jgi:uncharacterized protein (TIGR02145 family)
VIETKCGSEWYNASNSNLRCQSSVIETKCGSVWYDASNSNLRCQNSVIETKCGNGWYNASNSNLRCQESVIETKCGSVWYNASNSNLRCQSSVIETKCGSGWYDASNSNLRCQSNVVETKCGSGWYNASTQFCHTDNAVYGKCGGAVAYNPATEKCCGSGKYAPATQFCDARDSKAYKFVAIGSQTWMAENLNYAASGSKCGNGSSLSDANTSTCDTYGRLYNWATAMAISSTYSSALYSASAKHKGVCPADWHIPSNDEWGALMQFVKPSCSITGDCPDAGKLLKSTSGWNSNAIIGNGNGTNTYGFAALPGGGGESNSYSDVGASGSWWSSTEVDATNVLSRQISWLYEKVSQYSSNKSRFFKSVRCVQD